MKSYYLFVLLLSGLVLGCKKEKDAPKPEVLPNVELSLNVNPGNTSVKTAEIIISELEGKKLLDTVVTTYQMQRVKVRSQAANFIITVIYKLPGFEKFYMNSYVQVRPNNWEIRTNSSFEYASPNKIPAFEQATLKYTKYPFSPDNKFRFTDSYGSGGGGTTLNLFYRELTVNYEKHTGRNFTYLLIPTINKYKIAEVTTNNSVIDLAQMETGTRLKFKTSPDNLQKGVTNLFGYPLANNFENFLWLHFSSDLNIANDVDLIYPAKQLPHFRLTTTFFDASSNIYEYFSLADSVPSRLNFIDDSFIKINTKTYDQVDIEFLKEAPTYYAAQWMDANNELEWYVILPPGVTTFKAKEFFTSLGSTLLQGKSYPALRLNRLVLEKADNLTFGSFFDIVFREGIIPKDDKVKVSNKFYKSIR